MEAWALGGTLVVHIPLGWTSVVGCLPGVLVYGACHVGTACTEPRLIFQGGDFLTPLYCSIYPLDDYS